MDLVAGVVVVLVLLVVLMFLRTRSIVKRHAATLSRHTGIPADQIRREINNGNVTPGEWAARHGLDPWTFTPTESVKGKITKTLAQAYPSETILAVSEGPFEFGGGLVAVAATDQAVHSASLEEHLRNEYSSINKVKVESATDGGRDLFLLLGFNREVAVAAYLVDADSVVSAIDDQLAKITLHTERVDLTPDGGAVFECRKHGDKHVWWIDYDSALIGPDDRPTAEANAASTEAVRRLSRQHGLTE